MHELPRQIFGSEWKLLLHREERLLLSVYFHHIVDNIKSAGDVKREAVGHNTTIDPALTLMFLESMWNYLPQAGQLRCES